MFVGIRFVLKRHRLRASVDRTERQFEREIRQAGAAGRHGDDIRRIEDQQNFETDMAYEEVALLEMRYLCCQAYRHSVPVPDDDPAWYTSRPAEQRILTVKGLNELKSALRAERRERVDRFRSWLPAIAAGLSAIAVWVAAIKKYWRGDSFHHSKGQS